MEMRDWNERNGEVTVGRDRQNCGKRQLKAKHGKRGEKAQWPASDRRKLPTKTDQRSQEDVYARVL